MILLAALAAAVTLSGLILLVGELRRRAPDPGAPPPRRITGAAAAGTARQAVLAAAAAVAALGVTRWPVAAIATGAAVIYLPRLTSAGPARRRTAVLEGLEQWTRRLADLLAASRGLEDALEASARSAPAAVHGPVSALASRLAARTGTEAALRAFADEIDDPAGDRIAAALMIATGSRGGGVRDVLTALAAQLSRDVAARREIDADRAQHRSAIRWLSIMIAAATVVALLNRSYSAPYGTLAGQVTLAIVAGLYGTGLLWVHRLGSLPPPGRFLARSRELANPEGPAAESGSRTAGSRR